MGYAEYLRCLLRPMGVYDLRESSAQGGELAALGAAMDMLDATIQEGLRESLIMSAEGFGLDAMERLFPYLVTAASIDDRREALSGFLQISGDSFTAESLSRCLSACGTQCVVFETAEPNVVCVRFPKIAGEPEHLEEKKKIIESILPCHLEVCYEFTWCTWAGLEGLTFSDAAQMTFLELSMYGVG